MLPPSGHSWRLCARTDCDDSDRLPSLGDRFRARAWLQQGRRDAAGMLAMRSLLVSQHSWWDLSRTSDDEVIDQMADLLARGVVHVHVPVVRLEDLVRSGSSAEPEDAIAERSERRPAPAPDADTFSPDLDLDAQAATLQAAAADGVPFCPT